MMIGLRIEEKHDYVFFLEYLYFFLKKLLYFPSMPSVPCILITPSVCSPTRNGSRTSCSTKTTPSLRRCAEMPIWWSGVSGNGCHPDDINIFEQDLWANGLEQKLHHSSLPQELWQFWPYHSHQGTYHQYLLGSAAIWQYHRWLCPTTTLMAGRQGRSSSYCSSSAPWPWPSLATSLGWSARTGSGAAFKQVISHFWILLPGAFDHQPPSQIVRSWGYPWLQ